MERGDVQQAIKVVGVLPYAYIPKIKYLKSF